MRHMRLARRSRDETSAQWICEGFRYKSGMKGRLRFQGKMKKNEWKKMKPTKNITHVVDEEEDVRELREGLQDCPEEVVEVHPPPSPRPPPRALHACGPGAGHPPVPLPDEPAQARHLATQRLEAVHPHRALEPLANRLGRAPRASRGGVRAPLPSGPDRAGEELVEAQGDDREARLGGALAELAAEEDPTGRLEGLPHLHDELGLAAVFDEGERWLSVSGFKARAQQNSSQDSSTRTFRRTRL